MSELSRGRGAVLGGERREEGECARSFPESSETVKPPAHLIEAKKSREQEKGKEAETEKGARGSPPDGVGGRNPRQTPLGALERVYRARGSAQRDLRCHLNKRLRP